MLERPAEVRLRAIGEGMHGMEGLGWEGWRVVVDPGEWGVRRNKISKASIDISNNESGDPQAANNNFST